MQQTSIVTFARPATVIAICLAGFLFTHVLNFIPSGYNIDDWGHAAEGSDWGVLGRWGLEIFYRHVLGLSFSVTLQAAIAFLSFLLISFLLIYAFCDTWPEWKKSLAAGAVFLVGTSHPYWLDSHNFSTAIAAYPFAAALSVVAFYLPSRGEISGVLSAIWAVVAGGVLFGIALSMYQPAGLFGVVAAGAALAKPRMGKPRQLLITSALVVATLLVGLALYRLQSHYYFVLHPGKTPNDLLVVADGEIFLRKLIELIPHYLFSLTAGQFALWTPAYLIASFALLFCFLVTAVTLVAQQISQARLFDGVRVAIGLVAAAILPILGGWLVIEPDFPVRSMSLIAFPLVFLMFLAVHDAELNLARIGPMFRSALIVSLISFSAGLLMSSVGWTKQQRSYERDLAVAHAAAGALISTPPGLPIHIAGNRSYADLAPVATVGQSIFENYWGTIFIFKELYDLDVLPIVASPVRCDAVPRPGSVIVTEDAAYVCVEAFP